MNNGIPDENVSMADASAQGSSTNPEWNSTVLPSTVYSTVSSTYSDARNHPSPRAHFPERFSGKRSALRAFLGQLDMVFTIQARAYQNPSVKIATMGTLLTGPAADWFLHYVEHPDDHQEILSDWTAFKALMHETYGEQDRGTISANSAKPPFKLSMENSSPSPSIGSIHRWPTGSYGSRRDEPRHCRPPGLFSRPRTTTPPGSKPLVLLWRTQPHQVPLPFASR